MLSNLLRISFLSFVLGAGFTAGVLHAQTPGTRTGSEWIQHWQEVSLEEREREAILAINRGNVPAMFRRRIPIEVTKNIDGQPYTLKYYASQDVLSIGTDEDFVRMPMSPPALALLLKTQQCMLPTPQMVDQIHQASIRLKPIPIPPSAAMTSVAEFARHNDLIEQQLSTLAIPGNAILAGHKKDVVICKDLKAGYVALYGWHEPDGKAIQPVYTKHLESWVDYSHGARFIERRMVLNGEAIDAGSILQDSVLSELLSADGPVPIDSYSANRTQILRPHSDVKLVIQRPIETNSEGRFAVVVYALPNGNTIEQTIGRKSLTPEEWRFSIQNVGPQIEWLRTQANPMNVAVVYVANDLLSWPQWRREHGVESLERIRQIFRAIETSFSQTPMAITLTSHSGGGALVLGAIEAWDEIPDSVERIAFVDSNYAYEDEKHLLKFLRWLDADQRRHLSVLAYKDYVARLDGRPFVSEAGGTWGRSLGMIEAMRRNGIELIESEKGPVRKCAAKQGNVSFYLHQNFEEKILHSILVERNGLIHALRAGTDLEEKGYEYLGKPVYRGE